MTLDVDQYSRQVHYMTDNGAYYCYCNRFNDNHWREPMYQTVKELQHYHAKILGQDFVGLYHLDPFWHSHHPDGHCDGVTASNWSHSAFHWPDGLGDQGFNGTRWQILYMLAGPTFPTDLKGGNVYESGWPMEAQDLDTVVGGSGMRCCGGNSQVAASHSHAFWGRVLGDAVANSNLHAMVIDTLQVWATGTFTANLL